jgi:hypothetical protein
MFDDLIGEGSVSKEDMEKATKWWKHFNLGFKGSPK